MSERALVYAIIICERVSLESLMSTEPWNIKMILKARS